MSHEPSFTPTQELPQPDLQHLQIHQEFNVPDLSRQNQQQQQYLAQIQEHEIMDLNLRMIPNPERMQNIYPSIHQSHPGAKHNLVTNYQQPQAQQYVDEMQDPEFMDLNPRMIQKPVKTLQNDPIDLSHPSSNHNPMSNYTLYQQSQQQEHSAQNRDQEFKILSSRMIPEPAIMQNQSHEQDLMEYYPRMRPKLASMPNQYHGINQSNPGTSANLVSNYTLPHHQEQHSQLQQQYHQQQQFEQQPQYQQQQMQQYEQKPKYQQYLHYQQQHQYQDNQPDPLPVSSPHAVHKVYNPFLPQGHQKLLQDRRSLSHQSNNKEFTPFQHTQHQQDQVDQQMPGYKNVNINIKFSN